MHDIERLDDLLADAGARLDALEVARHGEPGFWSVLIDEEVRLFIEHDAERGLLVVTGDVAELPSDAALPERLKMMLQFNDAWAQSGGLHLAIEAPEGPVTMLLDLPSAITPDALAANCTRFSTSLRAWREILERPAQTGDKTFPDDGSSIIVRA